MSTFNNFTTTVSFSDFSAENWDALVKDSISAEHMPQDETEIQILQNVHQGTSLLLKNYINQVLNGAINHHNSALTTTYNRIVTLEAKVTHLWGELTRLPGGNIISKTKVLEPPTFAGSENKIHLYDQLSQIVLITNGHLLICELMI